MATPTQPRTTGSIDVDAMRRLHEHFVELENAPNILTLAEFQPFIPLFKRNHTPQDIDNLSALGEQYAGLIDPYKPVIIIRDSAHPDDVLLRLPRLFTALETPTDENAHRLAARNLKSSQSQFPKIRSEAEAEYMGHLLNAQSNDRIVDAIVAASHETDAIMQEFQEKLGKDFGVTPAAAVVVSDWAFDDDGTS
jgi:hypothetical protein